MCELWSSRERGEEQWEEKLQRGRQRDRERVATHPRAPSVEDGGSGADESREQERGARIHVVGAIEPPGNSVHAGIADSSDSRRAFAGPTGGVEARLELFERNTFNDDTFSTVAVAPLTPLAGTDEVEEAAQGEWILGVLEVEVLPKRLFGVKHGQMDLLEAGEGRWGQVWCVGW